MSDVTEPDDVEFCAHVDHRDLAVEHPYSEDKYCCWCGNGAWRAHAPSCRWADARDAANAEPVR